MSVRFLIFCVILSTGAGLGLLLDARYADLLCMAAAAVVWFFWDRNQGRLVLDWLFRPRKTKTPRVYGIWQEVIERVQRELRYLERKREEREERFDNFLSAIQASPNGVIMLDKHGAIEWCNTTAAKHFGIDPVRDVAQLIGNLVRNPAFLKFFNDDSYEGETLVPGYNDRPDRPVQILINIHPYGKGKRLLISRDVTQLEQAEAMRRDFVANVSHEIRTPLTVLSGFVETLQNMPLSDAERQDCLHHMAEQSARMQELVDDLLMLSKLEGSPLPDSNNWVNIQALMAQCERQAEALSRLLHPVSAPMSTDTAGQGQQLIFEPTPAIAFAGSAPELQSAIANLVSNAIRYTPTQGSVRVHWTSHLDGRVDLHVSDTGPGIAPEHIPRLTERFYRIDSGRSRETGGTGLGLAIVKHVLQRHGAQLGIQSTVGQGSTFTVHFPAARIKPQA